LNSTTTTNPFRDRGGRPSGEAAANWDDFAGQLAELADCPPERVHRDTRVIEDLGLDSLALAELVVVLMEKYRMSSVSQTLEDRVWENFTVGALYDEYLAGAQTGSQQSSTR
jgi:acyl carrier protein